MLPLNENIFGKMSFSGGGSEITVESKNITENGTYTAESGKAFSPVVVNVPQPSGSVTITENGTHDVTDKASAVVNVPNPSTGSLSITENGTYDVTEKASAVVNVAAADPYAVVNSIIDKTITYFKTNATGQHLAMIHGSQDRRLLNLVFYSAKNCTTNYCGYWLWGAINMIYVNAGLATRFQRDTFSYSHLKTIIIRTNSVCAMEHTSTFAETIISTGGIYVPDSLKAAYKAATNWSTYADYIFGYNDASQYSASTTYNIGDVCKYNNKFYGYCKEDLTSSTGNAPTGTTADNAYWEYIDDIEV